MQVKQYNQGAATRKKFKSQKAPRPYAPQGVKEWTMWNEPNLVKRDTLEKVAANMAASSGISRTRGNGCKQLVRL